MEESHLNREVIALFFKDKSKIVRLYSLIVLKEIKKNYEGKTFLSRYEYDVEYSKKFGYIFNHFGYGGSPIINVSGIYHVTANVVTKRLMGQSTGVLVPPKIVENPPQWVDSRDKAPFDNKPRTKEVRKRNKTRQLFKLPKAFDVKPGEDLLEWLRNNGIESESMWCSTCRDYFPSSNSYDLCEHVWWCENTGTYSTPSDRCKCKNLEECLVRY